MRNGIQFPGQISSNQTGKLENIKAGASSKAGNSFEDILQSELGKKSDLKISAHAASRLKDRDLELSGEKMEKVVNAVNKAADKGAKESLVLLQDMALIINVKNRTIITAMDKTQMQENIFTNIDSAIVV